MNKSIKERTSRICNIIGHKMVFDTSDAAVLSYCSRRNCDYTEPAIKWPRSSIPDKPSTPPLSKLQEDFLRVTENFTSFTQFLLKNKEERIRNTDIILDKIEQTRANNNHNWMAILKLAFKFAPDEAKEIMKKITKQDKQINEFCKELTDGEETKETS